MYVKDFYQTEKDVRPECVCYFILPKGAVGRISAGIVDIQPGGVSLSEAHTGWRQVFFVIEGTGTLVINGREKVRVGPNTVAEIPFDADHKVIADPGVKVRYLFVNDYSQPIEH